MSRFTAAQMVQARKKGTKPAQANAAPATGKVAVKVPAGGRVNIRRIDNGVVAEVTDSKWNRVGEHFAADASSINLE
ncbi:virion structural protein [Pseudomonas phage vB_PaeS_PAO1_Ab19]|uniref:virion structural protein n=1 Tax=Pseudomonas phage vB_PaeS_PAO1_Ab19 TaxID=1548912 RepID=UPI0018AFFF2A|nr:virion structural protein [Pseudomonas phage vB_PaeS_PAO1_Ab19]